MSDTRRSPDHGEIDEGGVTTVRTRAFIALNDVARAAYDFLYNPCFSGWTNVEALKAAVDALVAEIDGEAP